MHIDNPNFVEKPWGGYLVLESNGDYWLKKLYITRGEELSLQSHENRSEVWIVLQGEVKAQKEASFYDLKEGDSLRVDQKEKHRISAVTDSVILETAFGRPDENDIIRYQDKYGRNK